MFVYFAQLSSDKDVFVLIFGAFKLSDYVCMEFVVLVLTFTLTNRN